MVKTFTQQLTKHLFTVLITVCVLLCGLNVQAQKVDTVRLPTKTKLKPTSRAPKIQANVPVYKAPSQYKSFSTIPMSTATTSSSFKNLSINKIYPNPITTQFSVNFRLEKEARLSIKIVDQLGNNVVTLLDEKSNAGEHTKSFTLPRKLNTGMYYLRVIAGQETLAKRISVL